MSELRGRSERMRRLQIGITGLLGVLLIVGLAGIISDRGTAQGSGSAATEPNGTPDAGAAVSNNDPLSELGVEPSAPADPAAATGGPTDAAPQPRADGSVPDLQPDPALKRANAAPK